MYWRLLWLLVICAAVVWLWKQSTHPGEPLVPKSAAERTQPGTGEEPAAHQNTQRGEIGSEQPSEHASIEGSNEQAAHLRIAVLFARDRSPLAGAEVRTRFRSLSTSEVGFGTIEDLIRETSEAGVVEYARPAGWEVLGVEVLPGPASAHQVFPLKMTLPSGPVVEETVLISEAARVRGKTILPSGAGLAGVEVTATARLPKRAVQFTPTPSTLKTSSNAQGDFEFTNLVGEFSVTATLPDHASPSRIEGRVEAGQELSGLRLVLAKTRGLSGKITDSSHAPIAEAWVTVTLAINEDSAKVAGPSRWEYLDFDMRTTQHGEFTFESVPDLPLVLTVNHPHYAFTQVPCRPGYVEVKLGPKHVPAIVEGVVRDARQTPLPGAIVRINNELKSSSVTTDENGYFRENTLVNKDPNFSIQRPLNIGACKDGFGCAAVSLPHTIPGRNYVELTLPDALKISGRVVRADGSPLSSYHLYTEDVRLLGSESRRALEYLYEPRRFFKDSREFQVENLWPGMFRLAVVSRERPNRLLAVAFHQAGAKDVLIRVGDGEDFMVRPQLLLSYAAGGPPLQRVVIRRHRNGTMKLEWNSTWPQPQQIDLPAHLPETHGYSIEAQGYGRWILPPQKWEAGRPSLEARLFPSRHLKIRFLDSRQQPVSNVRVRPLFQNQNLAHDAFDQQPDAVVLSGADGRVWLPKLPAAEIELQITAPNGKQSELKVELFDPAGQEIDHFLDD